MAMRRAKRRTDSPVAGSERRAEDGRSAARAKVPEKPVLLRAGAADR